jgi:hypothetical protein
LDEWDDRDDLAVLLNLCNAAVRRGNLRVLLG